MIRNLQIIAVLMGLLLLASCSNGAKTAKRAALWLDIEASKKNLPIEGPGVSITDIKQQGDLVVYICHPADETQLLTNKEILNSDKNIARTLGNMEEGVVNAFIEAGMGVKYVYVNADNVTLSELEITPAKMAEVNEKMQKGEIKGYSILEMAQIEISQMTFPMDAGSGLWLTDATVKDNYIIYEFTIEANVEKSDITEEEWLQTKENTIAGLRESDLVQTGREEIEKQEIHFSYVYKDVRDTLLQIIDITPSELY